MSEGVELDEMHNDIMTLLREKRNVINDIDEEEQRKPDARERYEEEVSSLKSRFQESLRKVKDNESPELASVGVRALKELFQ